MYQGSSVEGGTEYCQLIKYFILNPNIMQYIITPPPPQNFLTEPLAHTHTHLGIHLIAAYDCCQCDERPKP